MPPSHSIARCCRMRPGRPGCLSVSAKQKIRAAQGIQNNAVVAYRSGRMGYIHDDAMIRHMAQYSIMVDVCADRLYSLAAASIYSRASIMPWQKSISRDGGKTYSSQFTLSSGTNGAITVKYTVRVMAVPVMMTSHRALNKMCLSHGKTR